MSAATHGPNTTKVVLLALGANTCIALAKLLGAFFSGSVSLLAEGIHSMVDTANQLLLLVGSRAAARPPNKRHPMGHGREAFFWSFLVAIALFSLGGLYSIYEGVHKLFHPVPLEHPALGLGILFFSFLLECASLRACLAEVRAQNRHGSLWQWFRKSTAADLLVVVTEDIAALLGLLIAGLCLGIAWASANSAWDATGSIAVGAVLLVVASFLAVEIKSLLIGESAETDFRPDLEALLSVHLPESFILHLIALQLGPNSVMISCKFHPGSTKETVSLVEGINRVEAAMKAHFPEISWQFFEPDFED